MLKYVNVIIIEVKNFCLEVQKTKGDYFCMGAYPKILKNSSHRAIVDKPTFT